MEINTLEQLFIREFEEKEDEILQLKDSNRSLELNYMNLKYDYDYLCKLIHDNSERLENGSYVFCNKTYDSTSSYWELFNNIYESFKEPF